MKTKKIILIFMSLALIISMVPYAVLAAEADEKYQIVINLTKYDIGDKPQITREDFTMLLYHAINGSDIKEDNSEYFFDVEKGTSLNTAVGNLYSRGIIAKSPDGRYRPEDLIKRNEAVTMAVIALGYKFPAEAQGGYYSGYIKQANNIGILKGVSAQDFLSAKDAMVLLYNVMNEQMMIVKSISPEGNEIYEISEETFLNYYRDIYVIEDNVNATCNIGLAGHEPCGKNNIVIGDSTYRNDNNEYDELIGCNVEVYYNSTDIGNNVMYMYAKDNNIEIIDAKEISQNADAHSLNQITGVKSSKRWKISQYADFIYNGKLYKQIKPEDFVFDDGIVKLIDNNDDNNADVVIIRDIEYMRISSVDEVSGKIYCIGGACFDIFNNESIKVTDENGQSIGIEEILTDDILEVCQSREETDRVIELKCVKNAVSSVVSAMELNEDGSMTIGTDIQDYLTSRAFTKTIYSDSIIEVGKSLVFFLNSKGEVVSVKVASDDGMTYAYLLKTFNYDGESGEEYELKLYTEENECVRYKLAEKVRMNDGIKFEAVVVFGLIAADSGTQQQMVKFSLNRENRIDKLYTAEIMSEYNGKSRFYSTSNGEYSYYSSASTAYDSISKKSYYIGNPVAYFNIIREPEKRGLIGMTDNISEEEIYVSYAPHMIDGSKNYMTLYDFGYANNARCVLVEPVNVTSGYDVNLLLVNKVQRSINEDNEMITKIEGWQDAQKVIFTPSRILKLSSAQIIEEMKKGDIYAASFDKQQFGLIEDVKKVYSADNEWTDEVITLVGGIDSCSKQAVVKGEVYDYQEPALCVDVDGVKKNITIGNITGFYIYDSDTGEYVITDGGEIRKAVDSFSGSKVIVYSRYSLAYDVVIIN